MNFDELVELSKSRREDASRRKNKRQFLEIEKNIYKAEIEKKAAELKARAEKLLHKDHFQIFLFKSLWKSRLRMWMIF